MTKYRKWIIGIGVIIATLVVIFIFTQQQKTSHQTTDNTQTKQTESNASQKSSEEKQANQADYQKHIANFTKVTAGQATEKLAISEDFVLYIGRGTCPYCARFVPILNEVSQQLKTKVYYLDTENYSDDIALQDFLKQHNVSYVPTLVVYAKGQVSYPDTPYTADELNKLLKSYGYGQ